jgi:protein TonB
LIAAGLAVVIHGLLLSMAPEWLKKRFVFKSRPEVVTLTLAFHKPQSLESKPATKRPDIVQKRPEPIQKSKEIKRTTEPVPRKPVKSLVASKPEPLIRPEQHEVAEKPPDLGPGLAENMFDEGVVEEIEEMVSISPKDVVWEARPIYRKNPPPEYPKLARKRGYQGTVILEVLVDCKGRAAGLRIFTSTGYPILDRVAMESVKDWLFEPGMRGNKKVEMWVRVPIRFQLK